MEPRTILPIDILISIIELLAGVNDDEGDSDIKTLQVLSQTCKFMVPLCRKHLFSSLYLRDKSKAERFSNLLSKNTDVARYVKSLNYGVYNPICDYDLNLLDILQKHSSLQSIKLRSPPGFHWSDFAESIRSSLVFLIQMPTVTYLGLESFNGFPPSALSRCSNLTDLQLSDVKFGSPEVTQDISCSKIPTPISLNVMSRGYYGLATLLNPPTLHTCGPMVDFSVLQTAFFTVDSPSDMGPINELIKVTPRLQSLFMRMDFPVGLAGLGASLAINAYRTLRLLQLRILLQPRRDCDPLCGLDRELRFIAGNNVLEELEVDVVVQPGGSCRTGAEDWPAFDTVLTRSDAFPMLHRVFVEIWWFSYGMDDVAEASVLESLKQVKFPRLVESNTVEFTFTAEIDYVAWCCAGIMVYKT